MPRSLTDLAGPITTLTRALVGAPDTLISPRLVALTLSVRISLQVCEGCEHVLVDTVILSLCLREGLSNCLKYREKGTPLRVCASLVPDPGMDTGVSEGDDDGDEPRATQLPAGQLPAGELPAGASSAGGWPEGWLLIELENVNSHDAAPLTTEQCALVFEEGYKAHTCSPSSDGLGLHSVRKAMAAGGGRTWLEVSSARAGRPCTILYLALPAVAAAWGDAAPTPETAAPPLPAAAAVTSPYSVTSPHSTNAHLGATSSPGVELLTTPALACADSHTDSHTVDHTDAHTNDHTDSPAVWPPLSCVAIDDSFGSRNIYSLLFEHMLHAERLCTLGATKVP